MPNYLIHPLVPTLGVQTEQDVKNNTALDLSPNGKGSYVFATQNVTAIEGQKFEINFKRVGNISFDSFIQLKLGGTATPDVDYTSDQGWISGLGYLNLILPAGQEFISLKFTALNDSINDSLETLRITDWWVGPRPAGVDLRLLLITIVDTSVAVYNSVVLVDPNFGATTSPTYLITPASTSVSEGSATTFTLTTTNVASGTSVPYTLSGISAADVSGGSLSGNAVVNSSGIATISVALLNDSLTEGSETLTVTAGGVTVSTIVNDTSKTPTYVVSAITSPVNEGSWANFTITTSNVSEGSQIAYTVSGVTSGDISIFMSEGALTGFATVNSIGVAYVSIPIVVDELTEGTETLTISVAGRTASILINDTSKTPYYFISTNSTSTTEGTSIVATLSTTNVTAGTTLYYQLSGSGINTTDFGGLSLTGSSVINSSGNTSLTIPISADVTSEGDETLVIRYYTDSNRSITAGSGANVRILDTSKDAFTPTYAVSANSASVNEGSTASFTLLTTNVASGTSVPYTLSGISAADVSAGSLSGNAVVNSSGIATISVALLSDSLTEGSETLTVTAGGATASTVVNDTSKTPSATYSISSSSSSVNEGSTATFTLTTTNVASGTSVPYTLSGISAADVSGGSLSGNTVVNSSGVATISILIAADKQTEGPETLTLNIQGQSASVTIYDTSIYVNPNDHISLVEEFGSVKLYRNSDNSLSAFENGVYYPLKDTSYGGNPNGGQSGFVAVDFYNGVRVAVYSSGAFWYMNSSWAKDRTGPNGDDTGQVSSSQVSTLFLSNSTPTYSLVSTNSSVNEGSTATFTLTTTNVASGTSVPYTLSGISAADVSGGSLSGNAVVSSSGVATISVTLINDLLTEGAETITVSAGGATASTTINDTSKGAVTPSYSLVASSGSINEGSTATFILTTSNVSAGTSVSYTISGISATDVSGGSLSGTTTVASNGQATISVLLANDNLTEGAETLTVTAGGASASAQINDTSRSGSPTYSISTNWTSTTEGTPIVATLSTTNVAAGTTLYYELSGSGITTSDFGGLSLTGSSVINSLGQASLTIPLSADTTTEGNETFVIQYYTDSGRSTAAGSAAYVTIQDTSKGAVTPTYAVSAYSSSVNEGSTADFTITTSNVNAGTSISYTLSGVTSSDITGGALTGFATVNSVGTATVSVPIAADNLTEGAETLTISLQGKTASILINDTSKAAAVPTYALAASSATVNEGAVATFTLTTTGVTPGTSVSYTISGVSSSDVTGGLSGVATIDTNGLATISVPVAADFLTEGAETLTVTAQGKTASVLVNDTSKTTLIASYALSASTNSVSEGSSAVFTLTTTNVAGGTSIPYTISGVSSGDITGGALSGTAIVSSSGNATITIPLALDLTTEGNESLTVTAQGISASVLISDTSTTPVAVTPTTTVTSIPYGDGKYFYVSSGSDKVTGTSFVDVVKQPSTVSSNQLTKLSDGSWQIQNKITPSNSDNLVNVERVEFSDMSVALDVSGSAGQVAKILGSVFGQSSVSNTVFAGMGFAYLDGGMSYLDLCGLAAGAAGLTTPDLLVTTLLRNTTGTEPTALSKSSYLASISSGASYASVIQQIADSSANAQSIKLTDLANTGLAYTPYVLQPTYSLSASTASVNEGSTAVFNLTTTNVAVGTEVSYTLSGISPSDLTSSTLTGKVTIGVGGVASINIPIAADSATEGQETLTVNAQGASATMVINDTSKGNATPTYSLTPATNSVNEGVLAQVYVSTTNVAAGTSLLFSIGGIGITQGDVIEGLSRFVTVDSTGKAVIDINTIADQITEGPETMYITLGTSTTSFIINDTSVTLVGVVDIVGGDGGGGGGGGGGAGGD